MFNLFRAGMLMAATSALLGLLGLELAGRAGLAFGLVLGTLGNTLAWAFGDHVVLRVNRAQRVDASSAPHLHAMVSELAARAGVPTPRLYLIDEDVPNAFATGRGPRSAAVALTTGAVRLLGERELRGVVAHELCHVRDRDILSATLGAVTAGAVSALVYCAWLSGGRSGGPRVMNPAAAALSLLVAPLGALLLRLVVSRRRELRADLEAARMTQDPRALASALLKLGAAQQQMPVLQAAQFHPATASLMIFNPLQGGMHSRLFATHPPVRERLQALEQLAETMHCAEYRPTEL